MRVNNYVVLGNFFWMKWFVGIGIGCSYYLEFSILKKMSLRSGNKVFFYMIINGNHKLQTNNNKPLANSQWRKIWSTDSPLNLHLQHQYVIIISCFLRLSIVKISPFSAVWERESYMRESFDLPKSFPRKVRIAPVAQSFIITVYFKALTFERHPDNSIFF